jgi:hypothetical protein
MNYIKNLIITVHKPRLDSVVKYVYDSGMTVDKITDYCIYCRCHQKKIKALRKLSGVLFIEDEEDLFNERRNYKRANI